MNDLKIICDNKNKKVDLVFIKKMNYEKFRIESFKNWPLPYINVKELASNGFYYTAFEDLVECNFCHIRIHSWEAEDTAEIQHKKWAPYCPLTQGLETENIKLQINVC